MLSSDHTSILFAHNCQDTRAFMTSSRVSSLMPRCLVAIKLSTVRSNAVVKLPVKLRSVQAFALPIVGRQIRYRRRGAYCEAAYER